MVIIQNKYTHIMISLLVDMVPQMYSKIYPSLRIAFDNIGNIINK